MFSLPWFHFYVLVSCDCHNSDATLAQSQLQLKTVTATTDVFDTFFLRPYHFSNGIAELIQVSWLEVSGQVAVEKGKKYVVKFTVKVKEDGFGWNGTRVLVMAKPGKNGKYQYKEVTLTPSGSELTIPSESDPLEISVRSDVSDSNLYFGLYEVWSGKWKGGLQIIGAKVEPAGK